MRAKNCTKSRRERKAVVCRRRLAALIAALAFLIGVAPRCLAAGNEDGKTVRVAYFDLGSYYQPQTDGTVDSFDSAYLSMVSEYTGLKFVYVDCGTWDNALAMLEAHEIDLVGTMQWTLERELRYSICDASYGYAVSELAAMPSSGLIYENYEQFNGLTVGYMQGYVAKDYLHELMEEKGFTLVERAYNTQSELDAALESGEIDLVCASAHAMHDDWIILSKMAYKPFYFASWQGNDELTDAISEALVKIDIHQCDFDDAVIKKYFATLVNSPYSKDELDLINRNETYTAFFDMNTQPLAWYDGETDTMRGILPEICGVIAEKTGLNILIRPISEYDAAEPENSIRYTTFVDDSEESFLHVAGRTEAIFSEVFSFYHVRGNAYSTDANKEYRVAVLKHREGGKHMLHEQYPNYAIVEYDTPAECVRRVLSGDADLTFLCNYVVNYVQITEDAEGLAQIPTNSVSMNIGLVFSGTDADLLASTVSKGYKLIDAETIDAITLKNVATAAPNATIGYFIKRNLPETILLAALFVFLLLLSVFLFAYMRVIRKKNIRIEAANRAKTDFLARMSHDLRTPLNVVIGMTALAEGETVSPVVRDYLQKVDASGKYLLGLINDILDMSKIESGRMEMKPEPYPYREFIRDMENMVVPLCAPKNITLNMNPLDTNVAVLVDKLKFKQIFFNVFSNAVKYTPEGRHIEHFTEIEPIGGGRVHCACHIVDDGCGMSEEFLSRVFEPFSREKDDMTADAQGTGLGLSITKNLCELMGGRIAINSEPGKGTEVVIHSYLPVVSEIPGGERPQKSGGDGAMAGKRALVAEDNRLNFAVVQKLLEKKGMLVTWAVNGQTALDAFERSDSRFFDLILLDIHMPVMDGIEAARRIRALARPDARTVPIAAMTANAFAEDKAETRAAGMNAHLAKPIDVELFYQTVRELLSEGVARAEENNP